MQQNNAIYLDDNTHKLESYFFIGQSGAHAKAKKDKEQLRPLNYYTEKEIYNGLKKKMECESGKFILVTHDAPHKILDLTFGGGHIGSKNILQIIKEHRPVLHLFGHCHYCGGLTHQYENTLCVNLASHDQDSSPGRIATVNIENDFIDVRWHSIPDSHFDEAFVLNNVKLSKTEDEAISFLKHQQYIPRGETDKSELKKSIENESEAFNLILLLYFGPISIDDRYYIEELSAFEEQKFCSYLRKKFNPWPKGVGIKSMLQLYKMNIQISDCDVCFEEIIDDFPKSLRPSLVRYALKRMAQKENKIIVDVKLFDKLNKNNLIFVNSEYVNALNQFLLIVLLSSDANDFEIIHTRNKIRNVKSVLRKHIRACF